METAAFYGLGTVSVVCALAMILSRHPVYAAIYLIGVLLSLAGLFVVLDAPLLGVFQVLVYAGAIMVLYLFVIMLLNLERESGIKLWKNWRTYVGLALTGVVGIMSLSSVEQSFRHPSAPGGLEPVKSFSTALFTDPPLLLIVELLSVLLLVAVVGAAYLGKKSGGADVAADTPANPPQQNA
jgi:NADH-quinone oxidoreductase subunit J